jgi:hypothetical protein
MPPQAVSEVATMWIDKVGEEDKDLVTEQASKVIFYPLACRRSLLGSSRAAGRMQDSHAKHVVLKIIFLQN